MAKCIYNTCPNDEHARGMCKSHYMKQRYKLKPSHKKVELTRSGKVNPSKNLNEAETINNIPESVLFRRFRFLDNLITL